MDILNGHTYFISDFEIESLTSSDILPYQLSSFKPLYTNEGTISLTERELLIDNSITNIEIPLVNITQLYLGFDDVYKAVFVKNFGLFWQPLRISYLEYGQTKIIYLIIDYNLLFSNNKKWFKEMMSLLSSEE